MQDLGDLLSAMLAGKPAAQRSAPNHKQSHIEPAQVIGEPMSYVSFMHKGTMKQVSRRFRCSIPASHLGAKINEIDKNTKVAVFTKPFKEDLTLIAELKHRGIKIVADFCDWYFDDRYIPGHWLSYYKPIASMADRVTTPTKRMAQLMTEIGITEPTVIFDPYEQDELPPHCNGNRLFWFGHCINGKSLERIRPEIKEYPLIIVSNTNTLGYPMPRETIPWTPEALTSGFAQSDIVIIPATADYKSSNRAVDALRQGCFVVAEPHPAWEDTPHIYVGNIKEGIEWTLNNLQEANQRILKSQEEIRKQKSPELQANAWRNLLKQVISA